METKPYEERLRQLAGEEGFLSAVIPVQSFRFVPEYRKYCEENRCGNYNRNYACPPHCGTPEEMEERTRAFQYALVLQSRAAVKNAMDNEETGRLKKAHNQRTLRLLKKIKAENPSLDSLTIMAGPCSLCPVCHMQQNTPCPMELDRYSCLSAYCIDVAELAAQAGMELSWDTQQVSYFSIFLYGTRKAPEKLFYQTEEKYPDRV